MSNDTTAEQDIGTAMTDDEAVTVATLLGAVLRATNTNQPTWDWMSNHPDITQTKHGGSVVAIERSRDPLRWESITHYRSAAAAARNFLGVIGYDQR